MSFLKLETLIRDGAEASLADLNDIKVAIQDALQDLDGDVPDVASAVAKLEALIVELSKGEDGLSEAVAELDASIDERTV